MENRKIANAIKITFSYFKKYLILVLISFIGITIYNSELDLLFKQKDITPNIALDYNYELVGNTLHKYRGHDIMTATNFSKDQKEILKSNIQKDIFLENMGKALVLAFVLLVLFLIIKGIIRLIKFTKKHAD